MHTTQSYHWSEVHNRVRAIMSTQASSREAFEETTMVAYTRTAQFCKVQRATHLLVHVSSSRCESCALPLVLAAPLQPHRLHNTAMVPAMLMYIRCTGPVCPVTL